MLRNLIGSAIGKRKTLVAGSLRELRRAVATALERSHFELALGHVLQTVEYASAVASGWRLMCHGSPELDRICADIGTRLRQGGNLAEAPVCDATAALPTDVYIASELYRDGGHTGLIGDYVRANAPRRPIILLTNIANRQESVTDVILDRVSVLREDVHICNEHSLVGKFRWLAGRVNMLRAQRVFLFNHMHDCVAASVIDPRTETQWWFVHHSNLLPCLGAHNPNVIHVDLTPFSFCYCGAKQLGTEHRYVPLTAPDQGCRDFSLRRNERPLTTASSGSPHKFGLDYRPSYAEIVARLLERTGGRHVHIGPFDERSVRRLCDRLKAHGVPPDRFVHVPYVPSVWKAMEEYDVDLYLSSFPLPGARTTVEVMGSGTPLILHHASELSLFRATSMRYPQAVVWREPADLDELVSRIDPEWLASQSLFARTHFERAHHPDLVRNCLDGECPISITHSLSEDDTKGPHIVEFDALLPDKNLIRRLRRRLSAMSPWVR